MPYGQLLILSYISDYTMTQHISPALEDWRAIDGWFEIEIKETDQVTIFLAAV